ncbi:MAG: hypothetical protein CK532_08310 [Flavobacteriales bacterium]|nr:MAG: hypothetical protein CK532_08310 [Flavobacteriales bacterium]
MKANWSHILLGFLLGIGTCVLLGILIASAQGIKPLNFVWAIAHFEWLFNAIFQLAIAANIGLFFLFIRKDSLIYFTRGWLIATMGMTIWAILIELARF